jgi:iron-sulfur cluster repair protein YtfE (RIC family)
MTSTSRSTTSADRSPVRQYLLPRQAAAPAGPVDVRMMYVMHHAFRRDLVMFADAAARTPADDREAWTALSRRWDVFSEILHHHHSGEDTGLWPRLMQVSAPEEQSTLVAMEAEHAQIDPILTACARAFERVATATDPATAAHLAEQLAAARDSLLAHLHHEENDAMALVQKYLTTEDWEQIEVEHFRKNQSFGHLVAAVPWVMHELPDEARNDLIAEAGAPMRLLWWATRGRFARLDAQARKYLGG